MNSGLYPGVDPARSRGRKSYSLTKNLTPGQASPDTFSYQSGELETGHGTYVVSFGISQSPTAAAPGTGFSAIATINFLVNGNAITRQISIGSGVSIQGAADAVSVLVQDTTPAGIVPTPAPYGVTISVSPGTRASDTQPTLLDPASPRTLQPKGAGGSTQNIPIPQNVGVVGVWLTLGSDGTADVTFGMNDVAGTNRFPFEIKDEIPRYIPIVPGTVNLVATNQDTNTVAVSTLWVVDG